MAKLDVKAFGLAVGIVWGMAMFLLGIMSMALNWGTKLVEVFSSMYIGYKANISGSVIGGAWGFVDAGIAGVIVAWLYNKFARKGD